MTHSLRLAQLATTIGILGPLCILLTVIIIGPVTDQGPAAYGYPTAERHFASVGE